MTDKKESKETNQAKETNQSDNSFLNNLDLTELIETTNLNILPKYDKIPEDDLITSRNVVIETLPKKKFIEKIGKNLYFMEISDNNIRYSLPADSIALQRSLVSLAIKESKAKKPNEIDLSKIIGKTYGIMRRQFTAKGFVQAPLSFYRLSD